MNDTDKDGKTALMIAVVNGHLGLVDLLLDNSADISLKSAVSCLFHRNVPFSNTVSCVDICSFIKHCNATILTFQRTVYT